MLQNLNSRRGGFTLVEIMIVVAIIALLATFAVPGFMRDRLRTQATACKEDLRQIDQAIDQYAMEKNKANGYTLVAADTQALAGYIKKSTALYNSLDAGAPVDTLGSTIAVTGIKIGDPLTVPATTVTAVSAVADSTFWSPFVTGT